MMTKNLKTASGNDLTTPISFRLTIPEYYRLAEQAAQANKKLSRFVRDIVVREALEINEKQPAH